MPKPGSGVSHGFTPRSCTLFCTCVSGLGFCATNDACVVGWDFAGADSATALCDNPTHASAAPSARPAARSVFESGVLAGKAPQRCAQPEHFSNLLRFLARL